MVIAPIAKRRDAEQMLGNFGLRIVAMLDEHNRPLREWAHDTAEPPSAQANGRLLGWLAVANNHAGLNATVFKGSVYQGGSNTAGGWKMALEQAPGMRLGREMRFAGIHQRNVQVPLNLVLDQGEARMVTE